MVKIHLHPISGTTLDKHFSNTSSKINIPDNLHQSTKNNSSVNKLPQKTRLGNSPQRISSVNENVI